MQTAQQHFMAQIFHPSTNTIFRLTIFGGITLLSVLVSVLAAINRSSYVTEVGVARAQPVPFSHKHHVADDGIDCRYCHTAVEQSSFAGIPSTKVCMNCHSQIWADSAVLEPVRESIRNGQSIPWTRVHSLPGFVYFDHSIHVKKGVGCSTCHAQVDRMPLMWRENTLYMEWCLECHRQPERFVRPREQVFNMGWQAPRTNSRWAASWCENTTSKVAPVVPPVTDKPGDIPMRERLSLTAVRARLAQVEGKEYWRSLEELAETEAFAALLRQKFPRQASLLSDAVSRRDFLKLMGASLALAGLGACARPAPTQQKILPYVNQPENWVPGKPRFFATAFTHNGAANGLLVESHEGRPTKIEGNPTHPASRGAIDAFAQASILTLYDPDRSQVVTNGGTPSGGAPMFDAKALAAHQFDDVE